MFIKRIFLLLCIMFVMMHTGCNQQPEQDSKLQPPASASPAPQLDIQVSKATSQLTAWIVYWDTQSVVSEIEQVTHALSALYFFEAYYNADMLPVVPDQLSDHYEEIKAAFHSHTFHYYLTVVNDWQDESGAFSLKDTALLQQLFTSENAMDAHAENLIELAIVNGYDGLEIDYEALRNDIQLWEKYARFLHILWEKAQETGLKLRIVLEPGAPFDQIAFPAGPEYAVMCYNYHGTHNGPGPKANPAFLKDIIQRSAVLPGETTYALATGGFDWDAESEVQSLTEKMAIALQQEKNATAIRDEDSQCLTFSYIDEDGERHEVWYADRTTLSCWIEIILAQADSNVALWRLGGNVDLARAISALKQPE
ncbi:MAG: glycosyl hydrolase [Christensenellales bacterium]|jgi:spore germination protein